MNQSSPERPRYATIQWLLILVPLAVVLAVTLLLFYAGYSSRNAHFEISPQALRIRGSLYGQTIPRTDLLTKDARIINLAAQPSLRPSRRTNGTSIPGFQEGWFRLHDNQKALLLVTNDRQVVYIPTTQGYAVMLSPLMPEVFLAALQHDTTVPVTFQVVPSASSTALWLTLAALVPIVVVMLALAPIVSLGLRQRQPFTGPADPDALYADHLVEITPDSILFRNYYFPAGSKRVLLCDVQNVQTRPLTLLTGKWRMWGGDFRTWFPADWYRPSRDVGFLLTRKGKTMRIGFTVEDSAAVRQILHRKGLLQET